jgi:hypothetical protein
MGNNSSTAKSTTTCFDEFKDTTIYKKLTPIKKNNVDETIQNLNNFNKNIENASGGKSNRKLKRKSNNRKLKRKSDNRKLKRKTVKKV